MTHVETTGSDGSDIRVTRSMALIFAATAAPKIRRTPSGSWLTFADRRLIRQSHCRYDGNADAVYPRLIALPKQSFFLFGPPQYGQVHVALPSASPRVVDHRPLEIKRLPGLPTRFCRTRRHCSSPGRAGCPRGSGSFCRPDRPSDDWPAQPRSPRLSDPSARHLGCGASGESGAHPRPLVAPLAMSLLAFRSFLGGRKCGNGSHRQGSFRFLELVCREFQHLTLLTSTRPSVSRSRGCQAAS